jgi:hypothetical protein
MLASVALMGALLFVLSGADAGGDKAKTLKGKITCAKCDLGVESKCMTVIVTKEDGKDVTYYFDAASHGKNHKTVCQAAKEGSVTGTISEKDGKKIVTAKKVSFE